MSCYILLQHPSRGSDGDRKSHFAQVNFKDGQEFEITGCTFTAHEKDAFQSEGQDFLLKRNKRRCKVKPKALGAALGGRAIRKQKLVQVIPKSA